MQARRWSPALLACLSCGTALAATLPLDPYTATNFIVSMPRSWAVEESATNGLVIARQDQRRDDSATVLFIVRTAEPNVTEDQLMDTVAAQFGKNLAVRRREAIPGGGHLMVADGLSGSIRVRVGVIGLITNGASLVSLLVAKTGEFDGMGGIDLVTNVLLSLKQRGAGAPTSATPAATPPAVSQGPPPSAANGRLDVPPPTRSLTFADFAGEWSNDDSVVTNYVNYRGDYAGFQSIATRESWAIDSQGRVSNDFVATTAGNGGARQITEKRSGAISFSQGMVMTLGWTTGAQPRYLIRGWRELPEMTVLLLNGPWYGPVPADVLGDLKIGTNLNSYWIRKAKK